MACLLTPQGDEFPYEKDPNDRSPSLCNQTSKMGSIHSYPPQEECKVEYTVKEPTSHTTDITMEKTPDGTDALQANHKGDQQKVVSQQKEVQVISEEENQEAKEYQSIQCSTEGPELVELADASIPTKVGAENLPEGPTAHGNTVSSKVPLTQEGNIPYPSPNRDIPIEIDVIKTVEEQETADNVHLDEQNINVPGLNKEGCLSQEHSTVHPLVTFATPLEEYFEYAVSLNPTDQISEPTVEYGGTDCEAATMYDIDENKFPDWKIPSSFDVALCKRSHIDESSETGHNHATIEECLKGNDVENKSKEELESERSLKDAEFPIVYREPSELLDANLDDDITDTAIKRGIDNNEGCTNYDSQEDPISSNMNCYFDVSSSPTESTKLPANEKDLLHPEVEQVIASVVRQVMATISPEEDVIMWQEYQRDIDSPYSPPNKGAQEKHLDALYSERYRTEEASENIRDSSPTTTTGTVREQSTSPIPQDHQLSECSIQEIGHTALGEVIGSCSPEQGHSHCSQVRNASTPLQQLQTHQNSGNEQEMQDVECPSESLTSSRDSQKNDVKELQRYMRQEIHEKLSAESTTAGTPLKEKNNDKVVPKAEQVDNLLSQEAKMKAKVETYEGDLAGLVCPVKEKEIEGTCVRDSDIDSSQCKSDSLTTLRGPEALQPNREEISSDSTRAEEANANMNNHMAPKTAILDLLLSQEDMFENNPEDYTRAPSMEDGVQKSSISINDKVENHQRDLGGLGTLVKYSDLEGPCVSDGNLNSSQTLLHSFPGQKSPQEGSQLPIANRNADAGKPVSQSGNEFDVKKETQFGPVSSLIVKELENIGNTPDCDSVDQGSDIASKNLQDCLQAGAYGNSMTSSVENITPMDEAYRQDMHHQNGAQKEGGEGKNSGSLSGQSRNGKLCSISSGHSEAIPQTHVPVLQENNCSVSDASERPMPRDQSQSHQSGDNVIGTDNIPCRNDPLRASRGPEALDIVVFHKVVRQEDHVQIPSDPNTAQTVRENNNRVAPNSDKVDNLLNQEDLFENEPNDAMKDDIQNYSPTNNAEIYDRGKLADVVSSLSYMETEGEDVLCRDKDSSQTLLHSFPSPNPSLPSSITHMELSDEDSQSPASDTKIDGGKTETQYINTESGLKTETKSASETPYSVTDSPYVANTGVDNIDQDKDIMRQSPQDHSPQGNAFDNSMTPCMDQGYGNGGQDSCKNSDILAGETKDGNMYSHVSGHPTGISQMHVPELEGNIDSTSNTCQRHNGTKAQQEITLSTPTPRQESGAKETGIETTKSIKLEETDIELLVEEISQKLDLTLEHLSPTPPQKYDGYSPTSLHPLQSDFVKVTMVRSQSQSSIICLQSLHDNIPDGGAAETETRSQLSSQRHSLKRRSASQDLIIPTKTQRSEAAYPISQPPNVVDPGESTDGSGKGEVASVELTYVQPPTNKANSSNDAVPISCQSPAKDCIVPESNLVDRKQELEGCEQWREDQAVPGNIEELVDTSRQCHLVEQDALSFYDDRTTDSKRKAPYEVSLNKHDESVAKRPEKYQQSPPDSATDTSQSNSSEDSVKSPRHPDHQTVPGSPRSSFKWRYAPSVDFDSITVVQDNMVDEDTSLETCRPLPLVTCRRPLRVGLSRRHRAPPLHPNFRAPRRLHDV